VFADVGGATCFTDYSGGFLILYVVHVNSPGATQSKFKVVQTNGAALTPFGTGTSLNGAYTTVGSLAAGFTVWYGLGQVGACTASPNWVISLLYNGGSSPECGRVEIVPHPDETDVLAWDCADPPNAQVASGVSFVLNPNASCDCTVPVWETTWGQIKALYDVE